MILKMPGLNNSYQRNRGLEGLQGKTYDSKQNVSPFNFKILGMLLFLFGCLLSSVNGSLVINGELENKHSNQLVSEGLKRLFREVKLSRNELRSKKIAMYKLLAPNANPFQVLKSGDSKRVKRAAPDARRLEAQHYTQDLLLRYGDDKDKMTLEDFDKLLANIGLKQMTIQDHDDEDHDHGDHDHGDHDHGDHDHGDHDHGDHDHGDHDHGDHAHRRKRRDVGSDPHAGHSHGNATDGHEKCLTSKELLADYELDEFDELIADDIMYLCPALIYQMDTGVCKTKSRESEKSGGVDALVWFYTMLSVFIISLCALFGILCIPKRGGNESLIMQFLIALAMGSMSGDGMLHLIPHSMVPHHDHGDEEEGHEDGDDHTDGLFKGLVALIGVYTFFFLERAFAIIRSRKDAREKRSSAVMSPMMSVNGGGNDDAEPASAHGHSHQGIFNCTSLAMIIIVGDMFHNFCDGLAIGAAFAGSFSVGMSTSIAVFCHELPHEIGDFAVLITSGMSRKRAIAYNLLSTVPCFFGAAIGLELGSLGDLSLWIFAFVGGLFMYIALVDLVPEMTRAYAAPGSPWVRYVAVHCCGIALGVMIMVILGIYEHDLQVIMD